MALVKCPECSTEISDNADKCIKCGFELKKNKRKKLRGCLTLFGIVGIVIFVIAAYFIFGSISKSIPEKGFKYYYLTETVPTGHLAYSVFNIKYVDSISGHKPDANFLVLHLAVRNDDNTARMIPNFILRDQSDKSYETSSKGVFMPSNISPLTTLNPGVTKEGDIVFDVPKNNTYILLVRGERGAGVNFIKLEKKPAEKNTNNAGK